jgi:DNA transformation protein and related proteins
MKHASPESLESLGDVLAQLRAIPGLTEKKPGIFYRKSSAFLHFHEDPSGLFADVKLNGVEFERFAVNSNTEMVRFVKAIEKSLEAQNQKTASNTNPKIKPKEQTKTGLDGLANLGPRSEAMLVKVGIDSVEKLKKLGAVKAYALVKTSGANASLNLLWALEGALTNLPWQEVARDSRLSLLIALEDELKRMKTNESKQKVSQ